MDATANGFSFARAIACSKRLCSEFSKMTPVGSSQGVSLSRSIHAAVIIAYREGQTDSESRVVVRATLDNIDRAVSARKACGSGDECPSDEFLSLLLSAVAARSETPIPTQTDLPTKSANHQTIDVVWSSSDKTPLSSVGVPDDLIALDLDGNCLRLTRYVA